MRPSARCLRPLVLLLLLALVPAAEPAPRRAAGLGGALARATRAARVGALGVHVRAVDDASTVFAHHAGDLFALASNTKLLTTGTALGVLGPGYFFTTELRRRGTVSGGTLHGDLAVIGGADPMFSWRLTPGGDAYAVFRDWARRLAAAGIRRVEGDLFLDHGLFAGPTHNPRWNPDKYMEWYQPPVAAFAFDENTVKVRAVPAPRPGRPATVETVPPLAMFQLHGEVRTLPGWRGNRLVVSRRPGSDELEVSGGVYVHADELAKPLAVADPVTYFGSALLAAFREEGVVVSGRPRPVPELPGLSWRTVAVHRTALLDVLGVTNHESQNLFAEMLVKLIGATRCGEGSWERGVAAVREVVAEHGVDPAALVLHDGSGLSRDNRMEPAAMTRWLTALHHEPWGPWFVATLPTGGEEGSTLEKRLDEGPYPGSFHAKTGTLVGISTLSGYARGRSGRLYAFSVLVRGGIGGGHKIQEAVVRALIDHG